MADVLSQGRSIWARRPARTASPSMLTGRPRRWRRCASGAQPGGSDDASASGSTASATTSASEGQQVPAPRPGSPAVPTPALGPSGFFITTGSIDGDGVLAAELERELERELAGPYVFSQQQEETVQKLREAMDNCSLAFVGVALVGIALSLAASHGLEVEEVEEVMMSGVTVGDVASWLDSVIIAALLRYGSVSFSQVVDPANRNGRQLAFTFQGLSRMGLIFQQFAIAAGTVSIVTSLEAAGKWPPLVTIASGIFSAGALVRSAAMWRVLTRYGKGLDDAELAVQSQQRCLAAAQDENVPLLDRLAIRVAFNYLQMFSASGRRGPEVPAGLASLSSASGSMDGWEEEQQRAASSSSNSSGAAGAASSGGAGGRLASGLRGSMDQGAAVVLSSRLALQANLAALQARLSRAQEVLRNIPIPILKSGGSLDGEEEGGEGGGNGRALAQLLRGQQGVCYQLTQAEERLVQATQSSLNSAGLALIVQSFATGLLLTANLATGNYSGALGDAIQAVNKAVAAELIFVATANFDRALYGEECDVEHLLEGLGRKGITKLFKNLSILAYAVVLAKLVALAAPWEESSPLALYLNEALGHRAADIVLEGQELLVNIIE